MQKTVICIGELLWDVYPNSKKLGGSSTNVAIHLTQQNINCLLISAVGDDAKGAALTDHLQERGLSTDFIQIKTDLPTSEVFIRLDDQQNATYTINQPVAWDEINLNPKILESVATADVFLFCSLTCREKTTRETVYTLADRAALAILDLNLRTPFYNTSTIKALLDKADILKINEDELTYLKDNFLLKDNNEEESLAQLAKEFSFKAICLTLGKHGAVLWKDGKIYRHGGFKVKVTDTVGAGDAFLASFVAGYLRGAEAADILEQACLVAAFVASHAGANPHYTEDLLNEFKRNIS